jgi:hypothetical protein
MSVSSAAGWVRLTDRCPSAISVCAGRIGTLVKRVSLFVIAMSSALLMSLLAGSRFAVAGGNCQAKLVGKSFGCQVKFSNGPAKTDCFEFNAGGVSQYFYFFDQIGNFGCACDTTASFKSPKFDGSSDAYECVDDSGDQINGKVKGDKISGQGTDIDGNSLIYSCTILKNGGTCG